MSDIQPAFFVEAEGRIVIEWPDGRPQWVKVCPEVLEEMVERLNELHALKAAAE